MSELVRHGALSPVTAAKFGRRPATAYVTTHTRFMRCKAWGKRRSYFKPTSDTHGLPDKRLT
jgi:hypothetical protein